MADTNLIDRDEHGPASGATAGSAAYDVCADGRPVLRLGRRYRMAVGIERSPGIWPGREGTVNKVFLDGSGRVRGVLTFDDKYDRWPISLLPEEMEAVE